MAQSSPKHDDIDLLPHKFQVDFALFCAKQVSYLTDLPEAKRCIKIVELWLDGKATSEECRLAAKNASAKNASAAAYATYAAYAAADTVSSVTSAPAAAYTAAYAAANAAVYAANAAYIAANAAYIAADDAAVAEQWIYYNNLLNFDSDAEKILLAGE